MRRQMAWPQVTLWRGRREERGPGTDGAVSARPGTDRWVVLGVQYWAGRQTSWLAGARQGRGLVRSGLQVRRDQAGERTGCGVWERETSRQLHSEHQLLPLPSIPTLHLVIRSLLSPLQHLYLILSSLSNKHPPSLGLSLKEEREILSTFEKNLSFCVVFCVLETLSL